MTFEKSGTLYSARFGTCPGRRDPFLPLFNDLKLIYHPHQLEVRKNAALVIWGGEDISPSIYGHNPIGHGTYSGPREPSYRDKVEVAMIMKAIENNIPIIGVCRGAQMVCAIAGGSLIQHVDGHGGNEHQMVDLRTGVITTTNSYHHQMMNPHGSQYKLIAQTLYPLSTVYKVDPAHPLPPGRVVEPEIIYFNQINALAIQGHPEFHGPDEFNEYILPLTERFLNAPSSL